MQRDLSSFERMLVPPVVVDLKMLKTGGLQTQYNFYLKDLSKHLPKHDPVRGEIDAQVRSIELYFRQRGAELDKRFQQIELLLRQHERDTVYIAHKLSPKRTITASDDAYIFTPQVRVSFLDKRFDRKFSVVYNAVGNSDPLSNEHTGIDGVHSTHQYDQSQNIIAYVTELEYSHDGGSYGPNTAPVEIIMSRTAQNPARLEITTLHCQCGRYCPTIRGRLPPMQGGYTVKCDGYGVHVEVRLTFEAFSGRYYNTIDTSVVVVRPPWQPKPRPLPGPETSKTKSRLLERLRKFESEK